jgi:hypothetical protein
VSEAPPFITHRLPYSWDRPDPETLAKAYLECFSTPAGRVVLADLEFRTLYTRCEGLREMGRQDLMQEILTILHVAYERHSGGA